DQYDRIITATSNVVKGLMNKFIPEYTDNPRYVTINNERYYMKMENPSGTNINVYTLNSVEKNNSIFIYLGIFSMLISLILYVLLDYLANKMSTENTASMDKLVYAVLELQKGNMNSYTDIKTGDEFEILGNQYNLMLDRLNKMIKKNEELSNLRRVQEVKQLQGQFNPHLIFNILETLKYAIVVDQEQAQDIIITLSRLLRYSIKDNGENVLFEDDLEYTKDYLKLHKIRFKERLNYSIKISENLKKAYVPKLILQPIIENSIKHAYKDKEFLNIYIKGDVIFDDLLLEIIDDGSGIEKEQLVSIKEMLEGSQNMTEHIGLYNIHRRLILLYGKGYGLEIESEYGEYTKVRIKVPYVRERYQ
ncbi:MAG: histidine kinase, partial [Tissierellaceae bacterium]